MTNCTSPLAGKPAPASSLSDVAKLVSAYYAIKPDLAVASQRVAFGTSGHRGCAFDASFNEEHALAITRAICDHRRIHDEDARTEDRPHHRSRSGRRCAHSGTEDIYKIYAESFRGAYTLRQILAEAQATVGAAIAPEQPSVMTNS